MHIWQDTYSLLHSCMKCTQWGTHGQEIHTTAHIEVKYTFWSRVTPPELLYIWLLSFDELRLAMNAHLPVVRPLLCYARRGATPMHQKIEVKYTALCKSSTWGYNNSPRLVGEKQTGAHDVLSRVSLSP